MEQSTYFCCCSACKRTDRRRNSYFYLLARRAVYNLWYSFVSTFSEAEAGAGSDTCDMTTATPSPLAIKPDLDLIRDTSQTTGSISYYADSDYSGPPSVGSSPSPPPAADSNAFQATNDGFGVDVSSGALLVEEQLCIAEPRRLDISLNRLPVFLKLGKGGRAPPLNYRSRSSSLEGEHSYIIAFAKIMVIVYVNFNSTFHLSGNLK